MNDINLSSVADWESIGTTSAKFTGIFDGNGHVIKNLKSTQGGLFGYTDGATIKNVGLENVDINSTSLTTGGLVSYDNSGIGEISNCYVTGSISGIGNVGGIIGRTGNDITNCYVNANINGGGNVGGIAGTVSDINMNNCGFNGNIQGTENVGGLVGEDGSTDNSRIKNCYSSGNVEGHTTVGGLMGDAYHAEVENCYTSCSVSGNLSTGLMFGRSYTSFKSTNVWADKKNSSLNIVGSQTGGTFTNTNAVSHEEFNSPEFWEGKFDTGIWDYTNSVPPILKDVGGQLKNWYFKESTNEIRLQVGEGSDPAANAMFVNTGIDISAMNIDLSTVNGCLDAVNCIKAALDTVAFRTTDIGVAQSRLETISNVNATKIENLTAAYATVTEADVAEETANFAKAQIMAQTAQSLITQAQAFQANMILRMINSLG